MRSSRRGLGLANMYKYIMRDEEERQVQLAVLVRTETAQALFTAVGVGRGVGKGVPNSGGAEQEDTSLMDTKIQSGSIPASPPAQASQLHETQQGTLGLAPTIAEQAVLGSVAGVAVSAAAAAVAVAAHDEEEHTNRLLLSGLFTIEASPAFKSLEALKQKGTVATSRIEELQRKHHELYQQVLTAVEYEKVIVRKTRTLQSEVARQKLDFEKASTKSYDDTAEIGELKRELLRAQNELGMAQERVETYSSDLEASKTLCEKLAESIEEVRRHKSDMVEPQLHAAIKDLRTMLVQRRRQNEILETEIDEKRAAHERAVRESERLTAAREVAEKQCAKVRELPVQMRRQIDVLRDAIASLHEEGGRLGGTLDSLGAELDQHEQNYKQLEEDRARLGRELEKTGEATICAEKELDDLSREQEELRARIAERRTEREDTLARTAATEAHTHAAHDALVHRTHEKESLAKTYRKLDAAYNAAHAELLSVQQRHCDADLAFQADAREAAHYRGAIRLLRRDIEALLLGFLDGEMGAESERQALDRRVSEGRLAEAALAETSAALEEMEREIFKRKHERELRAREVLRLQGRVRKLREDARRTEMVLSEVAKKSREAAGQLVAYTARCEGVKAERNRYFGMISGTIQRVLEMKEKTRILRSEVEILRADVDEREKKLAHQRQGNLTAYSRRDNFRMEANRLLALYREKRGYVEQQAGRIDTLSNSLNSISGDLRNIKARYEQVVAERNASGIRFLRQNDELCMLFEHKNASEGLLQRGGEAQTRLEARLRELQLARKEVERSLVAKKKLVPAIQAMKEEYKTLYEKVEASKQQISELAAAVETPTPERVRELAGLDPTAQEMECKLERLENALAKKEEKIMEKGLLMQEMQTITERLKQQTISGRAENSTALTRLNVLVRKQQSVERAMMAHVAEIVTVKRQLQVLEGEVKQKLSLVEQTRAGIASGCVPEFDAEWNRQQQHPAALRSSGSGEYESGNDGFRKNSNAAGCDQPDAEGFFETPRGYRTTAEPRPSAYLPADEAELPVPRPYGQYAPFKHTEVNAGTLRHYRKPTNKPVEL